MAWTLAQAKDKLSEVVRRAVDQGPQTISVRGKDTAVIMSKAQFEAMNPRAPRRDLKALLLAFPQVEELDLERDQRPARDFKF